VTEAVRLALTRTAAGGIIVGFVLTTVVLGAAWRWWDLKGTSSRRVTIPTLVIVLFVWWVVYPKLLT
jgi:hypothetical protein